MVSSSMLIIFAIGYETVKPSLPILCQQYMWTFTRSLMQWEWPCSRSDLLVFTLMLMAGFLRGNSQKPILNWWHWSTYSSSNVLYLHLKEVIQIHLCNACWKLEWIWILDDLEVFFSVCQLSFSHVTYHYDHLIF